MTPAALCPIEELTHTGRLRRYRRFASEGLSRYDIRDARLRPLLHAENTTFRVDSADGRFLFRIHSPGHRTLQQIRSELAWLTELGRSRDLVTPTPVPARNGEVVCQGEVAGVRAHYFVLFRWIEGRFFRRWPSLARLGSAGELLAGLHEHAVSFKPSAEFERPAWSARTLCDGPTGYDWMKALDQESRPVFRAVRDRLLADLPPYEASGAASLIHADFHHGNYLIQPSGAAAIDFDDCGFGHHAYDVATALLWFRLQGRGPEATKRFMRGYASVRSVPEELEASVDVFAIARMLVKTRWVSTLRDHPAYVGWMTTLVPRAAMRLRRWLDGADPFDL